jgi:ABC-type nitrate/sulfonate/bicarbonate transport system substrate-binding protein
MDTLRLGLEWFLNPDHVPLLLAQAHGWFADAGLEVEIVEPEAHLDAVDAIEAGTLDLAITEPLHLVEDRAAGHAVVGFARFLHTNGGVMYLTDGDIARPRDMACARIQYPGAPGPGGPAIVATMIEADGGTADLDAFTRVNRSFYHTDALADDDADVATLAFYNFELVEARERGLAADFFALKDWGVPDFCQLVLVTTEPLFEAKRDAFTRFVGVLRRGIDALHQRPGEARMTYMRATETAADDTMTGAIFDATLPCFTYDFSMTARYYERLGAWMHRRGLIDAPPAPAACWTNDLALPTRRPMPASAQSRV